MSGWPRCASVAPSHRRDQRVDDRLRVHDDVDPLVRRAEQPVRLDHLEALVHQRRRVDRDLAAHRPGRVRERLLDVTSSSSARVRPRNGPPDAVSVRRSTVPGPLARRSAGAAPSARSRPGSAARRWPRTSAITSSPPTTSDSLLASATSIPSPSATIVGPSPAEPTIALSTRSAPDSATSRTRPSGPASTSPLGPRLGGARGGVGVGERDPRHAVGARLRDQRLVGALGGQADELERLGRARDDVERLRADRAGRAEDQEPLHPATQCGTGRLRDS